MTILKGDAGRVMTEMAADGHRPDVVFMDPPRTGSDGTFLKALMTAGPDKIVYISCNPVTLKRDLSYLKRYYSIKKIIPVDMFPYTQHVESCVLLERVSNRKADSYVKLNVKMADYYRIKDSAETENAEE